MTDQFTPTREDFEAVAKYVGIDCEDMGRGSIWANPNNNGFRPWTPHLPGADAFDLLRDAMPNHVVAWYADGEEHEGEFYVSERHDNTPEGKARATALAIFKAVLAAAKAKGDGE